jgi:hypothetical protein
MKNKIKRKAHVVMISWNNHMPRREAATPRTAEETICVMGEVTLIDKREAMDIRKPRMPFKKGDSISSQKGQSEN